MSKYIAYKKNGSFDLNKGFIDESCFKEKSDEEITLTFDEEGFDVEFIDQSQFEELTRSKTDPLEDAKIEKYNEVELLRKFYQFQPVTYEASEFSGSQMARQNMTAILIINDLPDVNHYWKDINEVGFEFTLNDFTEILKLISKRDTKFYCIEAQINNEIESLNLASIQSLNITESWQGHEANYIES